MCVNTRQDHTVSATLHRWVSPTGRVRYLRCYAVHHHVSRACLLFACWLFTARLSSVCLLYVSCLPAVCVLLVCLSVCCLYAVCLLLVYCMLAASLLFRSKERTDHEFHRHETLRKIAVGWPNLTAFRCRARQVRQTHTQTHTHLHTHTHTHTHTYRHTHIHTNTYILGHFPGL
jgi:hypothetical protein